VYFGLNDDDVGNVCSCEFHGVLFAFGLLR